MTKGKDVFETKLNVGLDRRATFSVADRQAQFDAANRVKQLFGDMSDLVARINAVRTAADAQAASLPAQDANQVRAVAYGFISGGYSFKRYKSGSDEAGLAEVSILSDAARRQDAIAALEAARTVGDLVNRARDWVNTPPNDLTPELFADQVLALGKELTGRGRKPKVA